ncbi:YagK/YfjJ domain-containing protein [Neptunomonas qingdaonensis]|uniref:YagK/YfjJ C-terminal domain-containing protein n=1 Tax=Neptunomonas qingdaonensis TaxID=1045558 RepID=A0A1I2QFM6_9GAMM|nr:inovirus-type Gp2 protein [Neptunomonas qingdaonensis]SFG24381.1 Protein of unknown function [Neptunomonas qingdaonensis]
MCGYEELDCMLDDKWNYEINEDKLEVTDDRDIGRVLVKIDKMINKFDIGDVYFVGLSGRKCGEGKKIYRKLNIGYPDKLSLTSKVVDQFFRYFMSVRDYKRRGLLTVRAFSPNITAYMQWMDDVDRSIEAYDKVNKLNSVNCGESSDRDYTDLENRIYKCFMRLSDKINSPSFKKLKLKVKKTCDKNYRSMLSYIDKLFEKRSRLLVVRVDLSYKRKYNDAMKKSILNNKDVGLEADEFEKVKSDMERLLRNRRNNTIFNGLLGYIWKLEYGVLRRYHFHVLFFFNSSTRCRDATIGENIGEYWSNEITEGRGAYFNVNGSSSHYQNDARGQVHCTDGNARNGLRHIASYFSKADYFMRLELPKRFKGRKKINYRTMGKGQLQESVSNLGGRPRELGK